MAYLWTTPVVNREDGTSLMKYTDMYRITNDIGYLQEQVYGSATISKTSWERDDIITKSFWESMLSLIGTLSFDTGCAPRECNNNMTYDNINEVEKWLLDIYNAVSGVTMLPLTDANNDALTDHNLDDIEVPVY